MLCSGLLALGCSSGETKTARELCVDYQDAFCAKASECDVPSDRADLARTCQFFWQVYSSCDRVTRTTERYPVCVEALRAISCTSVSPGDFPDFPNDCQGIFYEAP